MNFLLRWALNIVTLILIAWWFPGIEVSSLYAAIVTVVVLSLVNAIIRPILILFTLPLNIITLGLFVFVINGFLFWFVSTFIEGFEVAGFWSAFWGAMLMSIASWLFNLFLKDKKVE